METKGLGEVDEAAKMLSINIKPKSADEPLISETRKLGPGERKCLIQNHTVLTENPSNENTNRLNANSLKPKRG